MRNRSIQICLYLAMILSFTNCTKGGSDNVENIQPKPVAAFSMNKSSAKVAEEVIFTNNSTDATTYVWEFGDGTTSTEKSPIHNYLEEGTFTVSLKASSTGGEDSVSKAITIDPNFEGDWKARNVEEGDELSSALLSFTIVGSDVTILNWSARTNIGYFFGSNWSTTLSSDNTFTFSPKIGTLTLEYHIALESSSKGVGTFSFRGQDYDMEVDRK